VTEHTNPLAGAVPERLAEFREDRNWLEKQLRQPDTAFIPVHRDQVLVEDDGDGLRPALLDRAALGAGGKLDVALLGRFDGRVCFALASSDDFAPPASARFTTLRSAVPRLGHAQSGLLAYARALVHWHETHRFCGRCGAPTAADRAGHLRRCTRRVCDHFIFPRIDPAVIVLVEHGDRCLLGRQPQWEAGRYSTIAGFVEPGEALEDAVRRELLEETGVDVGQITYHSSQPWPFPASIMLGFLATAKTTDIRLHDAELEDARWFSREDMRRQLAAGELRMPTPASIAFSLVEHWFNAGSPEPLSVWLSKT
jgi:NAD+ diphosphatase